MKLSFSLFLFLFSYHLVAQDIEVLKQSNFQPTQKNKKKVFAFIEPSTDSTDFQFIATIRATGKRNKGDIRMLYDKIRKKALKLGANSFGVQDFKRVGDSNEFTLTLHIYHGTDSALKKNAKNHESNVVYVFGDLRKSGDNLGFKVNDKKDEIKAGSFYRQELQEGQEITLTKGISTFVVKREKSQSALFFILDRSNAAPAVLIGVVGLAFSVGQMLPVDRHLGYLLVHVLKSSQP
ncbi:MAG: hypothetical protein MUC49_11515 [Raineya sp.]|jgi:hypothetical protein|nr:hypothetical protein [Raineya sp.]